MQFTTLALTALASVASAQKTWVVAVAQNGTLTYSPNKLAPQPGEFVQFQFHAGNHTVTQSTFDQPCQPIAQHSNVTGFHSGFLPAAASAAQGMIPTYTIQINDTKPIWVYCAQGKHCEAGMVAVINEPTNNASRTLENFKSLAAKASTVIPGEEAGSGGTTGSTTGTVSSGGSSSSSSSSSSSGSAASPSSSTAGAGVLAAPGTIALVAAAGAALFL